MGLITGTCFKFEKLRCVICDTRYEAQLPPDIMQRQKYDATCYTAIAIARYYLGLPFKRIETAQAAQGVPLADATQWDKMNELHKVVRPILSILEKESANGDNIAYDDSPNRILSHKDRYNNKETTRKSICTTAIVSQVADKEIVLFYTSERYAGEEVSSLLANRSSAGPLMTMSDASPNNRLKGIDDKLLERWVMCFCLVHGRRKFFEICDFFDKDCDFVLGVISKIYHHEKICREGHYSPEERLRYHQAHSAELMESLRIWLNNKLLYLETEANSSLGEATRYMLKHWKELTKFLHVAGALIDNSLCERAIKVAIRHRKNSLFFKTSHGAEVGDCLMSLIHTAVRNGVSPYNYLNNLQWNAQAVKEHPEQWLPWNYEANLTKLSKAA